MDQDEIDRKRARALKYDERHRAEKNAKTAERYQQKRATDPDGLRAKWRAYKADNKEAAAAHTKRWYQKNWNALKEKRIANRDKIAERSKAWQKANPEKVNARQKRYQQAHPEVGLAYRQANKERLDLQRKAWKRANPDKVRENTRKWHAAHPEVVKNWRKANPEAFRAQTQTRHARMANAEGRHTADELKALFQRQHGKCAYCSKSIRNGYHVDHVIPLARGGSNWITNISLACARCNLTKSAADPIEFARRNGKLL
jgi:5-methylcytosine-specific restriction endonuclease McrA